MKKIKWKNIILVVILLISIVVFGVSIYNIGFWLKDSKKSNEQIDTIYEMEPIEEVEDSIETEIIEQEEVVPPENPYWDYISMNLIDVDFKELKKKNDSTVGWIQVNGTNINYPFVQTTDNDFYLTHTYDKSYNKAGWVFMDYRNNKKDFDQNTILYAHGRLDDIMFGSLKRIMNSGWLNNSNNYVVKLSTEYENTLWQVFSVYRIPTTSDYLQINFSGDDDFINFADKLIKRSAHNFNTTLNGSDKILTLSTCWNDYEKVVLHAKLIKREAK